MLLRKWMKKKRIPQNRVSLQKTLCTRLLSLIKKKKMQELENLLNFLIKRGRKPWGRIIEKIRPWGDHQIFLDYSSEDTTNREYYKNYRELVSMESWLWQFVCQNKLLSDKVDLQDYIEDSFWFRRCPRDSNWSYRLMRVAFVGEEDLEKFLIDNIKL